MKETSCQQKTVYKDIHMKCIVSHETYDFISLVSYFVVFPVRFPGVKPYLTGSTGSLFILRL